MQEMLKAIGETDSTTVWKRNLREAPTRSWREQYGDLLFDLRSRPRNTGKRRILENIGTRKAHREEHQQH